MRILLIEDDTVLGDAVRDQIAADGQSVDWVTRLDAAADAMAVAAYDLILLDLMLPDGLGVGFLKTLRHRGDVTPVIILTALDQISDRIEGLNAGADDYLVKPFAFGELSARINALGRRPQMSDDPVVLRARDLEMNLISRKVTRAGQSIDLLPREFALLEHLLRRKGRVQTRTMLLESVWDIHFDPQTNVVETHISRLRSKVDKPFDSELITTVRGAGYRIDAE